MDDDKRWSSTILGITAGVLGGTLVGLYVYVRARERSGHPMRDAQDIIAQCYEKIEEIEAGLDVLRSPGKSLPQEVPT